MKKRKLTKIAWAVLIFIVVFPSCRELVQDEFPEFENKVTVNTIISAGDSIKVYLAYTDELNENPLVNIENAEVNMSNQDGLDIEFKHIGNGEYISEYIAKELDSLDLLVNVPGENMIISSCIVPQKIEVYDANVNPYGWINEEGVASPLVSIKIKNTNNKPIYGVVYAKIYFEEPSGPNTTWYWPTGKYKPIGTIDNINCNTEYLDLEIGMTRTVFSATMISMAFQLKLRTVDYNYYTYLTSIGAYEVRRNPDFTNSYIVPSNLFSNIENGYGIMGSYTEFETDTIF